MTTISSLASTILQDAMSQLNQSSASSTSTSGSTQSANALGYSLLQSLAGSSNTAVTLGSNVSTPVTYSSTGKLTQAQAEQLVQTIDANVANTIGQLFSGTTTDTSNSGISALLGSTGSSTNSSSSSDLLSLLNSVYPAAGSSNSTTQTIQSAITASQNAITNTLGSL
jgi:hypothetical protein